MITSTSDQAVLDILGQLEASAREHEGNRAIFAVAAAEACKRFGISRAEVIADPHSAIIALGIAAAAGTENR
jgi:hypothetical protein